MKNYIMAFVLGASLGFGGGLSFFNYTKKEVKVSCPACPACPPNSIDINKLKDFRGKFTINQTYQVNSDSISRELIIQDMKKVISEVKLSRCK